MQLPGRFDDADVELMRYAGTAGLMRTSPEKRPAVVAKSARAVQATTEWLAGHEFLTDAELRRWDDLVRICAAMLRSASHRIGHIFVTPRLRMSSIFSSTPPGDLSRVRF